ncbi:hypothetical protein [Microbaculum marinum]|uniref:Uncharacterized protein n=1 Tax=Microbaculum marinum TaxID=1764581 RepID=A0AAW9RUN8_9HYPH
MRRDAGITVLAALAMATVVAAAVPAIAAVCPEGETKFRNGVFYTCTCYGGGDGGKTCFWKPD